MSGQNIVYNITLGSGDFFLFRLFNCLGTSLCFVACTEKDNFRLQALSLKRILLSSKIEFSVFI
jgi:hypothetical protein